MSDPLVEVLAERQIRGWRLGTEAAQSIVAALRSRPDLLLAALVEWGVLEEVDRPTFVLRAGSGVDVSESDRVFVARQQVEEQNR